MKDLLLGLSMVGVGYLMVRPQRQSAEIFRAESWSIYKSPPHKKISEDKLDKFWDVIATPYKTNNTHYDEWAKAGQTEAFTDITEIPSTVEYRDFRVIPHRFDPLEYETYFNKDITEDKVGITASPIVSRRSDFLSNYLLLRGDTNASRFRHIAGLCCPSDELESDKDWQNDTGRFDPNAGWHDRNTRGRGKSGSDRQRQDLIDLVDTAEATYAKYIDLQGNYLPHQFTTDQDWEDFHTDLHTLHTAHFYMTALAQLYFIHEMEKKGGLFKVSPSYAPDNRRRKVFPEADGYYVGESPTSWSDKPNAELYMALHNRRFFEGIVNETYPYLLWCPFLEKQFQRLKAIDFVAFREYIEKIGFYVKEPNTQLVLKDQITQLTNSLKSHKKELKTAQTDSKKLVDEYRKRLEKEDKKRVADFKKEVDAQRALRVKERETEIKEVVLKEYPKRIAAEEKGVKLRKQLTKKLQQTEQALKQEFSQAGIIVSPLASGINLYYWNSIGDN